MKSPKLLSLQLLEDHHATKLKPIVDDFIKSLTDKNNIQKLICNNTDRCGYHNLIIHFSFCHKDRLLTTNKHELRFL